MRLHKLLVLSSVLLVTACCCNKPVDAPRIVQNERAVAPTIESKPAERPTPAGAVKEQQVKATVEYKEKEDYSYLESVLVGEPQTKNDTTASKPQKRRPVKLQQHTSDAAIYHVDTAIGDVAFNPPAKMRVGKTETVKVVIDESRIPDAVIKSMGANVQRQELLVSRYMVAKLNGDAFDITTDDSPEQVVDSNLGGPTSWTWKVLPLKAGKNTLTLKVYIRVKLPNMEPSQRDLPVIEKSVVVESNNPWLVYYYGKKYWKELLSAVTSSGVLVWLYKRVRRKLRAKKDNTVNNTMSH